MTTPLITNIIPPDGTVSAVGANSRFSVRDALTEINLSTLQLYLGTGPVFYRGGTLPEDLVGPPTFYFQAQSGSPGVYADREILGDDFLRISKSIPSQNQEATYFMGGLEAPAEATDPLMAEFTLRLNKSEVTVDGNKFTGVLVGLFIGNTGLTVKFFTDAGVQRIEVHDAAQTTSSPANPSYVALFDWDEAVSLNPDGSNTYKVLWYPQRDLVRLYVKDPSSSTDRILVDGFVADFPTIPVPEQRENQPWLFFGHGAYPTQTSISEWIDVYLLHIVSNPVRDGIIGPEHITELTTNNPTYYDGTTLPWDSHSSWQQLPSSFGTLGGSGRITSNGLILERSNISESIGFYRVEPKVTERTVLDFRLSGEVVSQETGIETSGIEAYIDDGTKQLRMALLQDLSGTQYVGILKLPSAASIASYESVIQGFSIERNYRLVLTPSVKAELFMLVESDEGIEEIPTLEVPYSLLVDSGLPGPGIGFLHNANSGGAVARMTIRQIRYTTDTEVTDWEDFVSPTPSWSKLGSGTVVPVTDSLDTNTGISASIVESGGVVTVSGLSYMQPESVGNYLEILNGDNPGFYLIDSFINESSVTIVNPSASGADSGNPEIEWSEMIDPSFERMSDASSSDNTYFKKEYTGTSLQSDNGWSLEFRARIVSYEHDSALTLYPASGLNPVRASTGFVVQVLDGTYRTALVFAEAGPPNGKIVFLATDNDTPANLLAIRAQDSEITGTFHPIDWTSFHLYRLEKTVGGALRLYVDEILKPVLEFENREFAYPPHVGGGNPRVEIGHMETGIQTVSDFQLIKFSISDGFDISCRPVLTEDELMTRFSHGSNVIVETENT